MRDRLVGVRSELVVQSTTNSPRNSCPASCLERLSVERRLQPRAASITALPPSTVERDAVVWPVSSSRSVSTTTRTRSGGSAELLAGDLPQDGVHALAHLRPGVEAA